jgi:hypothetical protein
MRRQPPIGGTLFPSQYLDAGLVADRDLRVDAVGLDRLRRRLERWWNVVEATCGPASGPRALLDLVAMPLFGALGFVARDIRIERGICRGVLVEPVLRSRALSAPPVGGTTVCALARPVLSSRVTRIPDGVSCWRRRSSPSWKAAASRIRRSARTSRLPQALSADPFTQVFAARERTGLSTEQTLVNCGSIAHVASAVQHQGRVARRSFRPA